MTSLALIFVIFLNCMLCARCELTKSTAKWAHGINSVFIGDKITHKELEVGPPFAQKENMSLNDDLSLLKIIVQNTGDADVYRCVHYVIAGIDTKPTCSPVILPTNDTEVTHKVPVAPVDQLHHKPHLHFPSNFKRYNLSRLSHRRTDNAHKFITKIHLPWQMIRIYSDEAFAEAEVEAMHDALYESVYTVTKMFNVSRPMFLEFIARLPKSQAIFVISDQKLFRLAAKNPVNGCWLYSTRDLFVNKAGKCGSYLKLLSVLYTLYMEDGYLTEGGYGPHWWKMGLSYYAAGYCFENEFKGKEGLRILFHKHRKERIPESDQNAYGSVLHGFLDSTPELRKYHLMIFNMFNKYPRYFYSNNFKKVVKEIIHLYGDTFKNHSYCKLYETYDYQS